MKEMVERNKILEIITGSQLYGTALPTSDQDITGIFIADKQYYLGLEKVEEVDLSIVSKSEDGKNDVDAIDRKFHEFRKYIRLAADGNPNILELLFVSQFYNKDNIIFINDIGNRLLENRQLFPSRLIKQKFIGYAISQLHKAKCRPENFNDLRMFVNLYEEDINKKRLIELQYIKHPVAPLITFHKDHATIGGLNFNLHAKMSTIFSKCNTRLEKSSHRQDMWLKYGVDVKFLSHCVRLILEGIELLETGCIIFPLREKQLLIDIRNGNFDLKEVHEFIDVKKKELDNFESFLPATPDFKKINDFLIETIEEHWR